MRMSVQLNLAVVQVQCLFVTQVVLLILLSRVFFRSCINELEISYLVYENDDIAAHVTRELF